MKEFSLIIDYSNYYGNYDELFEYLYALNGIEDVVITSEYLFTIYVKYNEKLINAERIKLEILAFGNLLNYPCIYGYNKHLKNAKLYKIIRDSICCDFCYFNLIEYLYEIDGITGVESNFYQKYWTNKLDNEKYIINIFYDPKVFSLDEMKKLEIKLDI